MDPFAIIEQNKMPFTELLGVRVLSAAPERLTAEMLVRENFCTVPSVLHGGAVMAFADSLGAPVIPCGCSQRTGTVRRTLRDLFGTLEKDYPHLKETLLSAMGNLEPSRLLDPRYLDLGGAGKRRF